MQGSMKKGRQMPTLLKSWLFLLLVLALLVGYGAGSLAGRLARSLTLAAAAFGGAGLQSGPTESVNMLHWYISS